MNEKNKKKLIIKWLEINKNYHETQMVYYHALAGGPLTWKVN